ncbi:MAG: NAD+ synthase [Ignavibacteria bacterium]|nr:NAD+ synthase [Ignavibacteria bacterium]
MELNNKHLYEYLTVFLRNEFEKAGFLKGVIGLSGGIDSAVSAYIGTEALGKANMHFILMPYKTSSEDSITDAMKVVNILRVSHSIVNITPMVDAYLNTHCNNVISDIRKGNVIARMRMIVLYDFSAKLNALVIGTGNKTEILLGYTTLFGDSACAINPVGDLYKTQLRSLARYLSLPESILNKKPSADLWKDQTDEGEMGLTYEEVDNYLFSKYERNFSEKQLIEAGFNEKFIEKVNNMVMKNKFKSMLPVIARIPEDLKN